LTGYYVEIEASAVKDESNNFFAGFAGNPTWSFTTAGTFISTVSLHSFSSQYTGRSAVDALNNNGFTSGGSGNLGGTHNRSAGDMWLTNVVAPPAWSGNIIFDFSDTFKIDTIRVWNYNENNLSSEGMKDVEIWVSKTTNTEDFVLLNTNGSGFTDNGSGIFLFTRADETTTYGGFNVDLSSGTNSSKLKLVRLMMIHNTSNYQNNTAGTGLSEIQFSGAINRAASGTIFKFD
jgi:hypothetical protein